MKKFINIALDFSKDQTYGISPAVTSVHVYPLRSGNIGNFSCQNSWALEYHSKDAGFIELRNDLGNWHKRHANSVHIYSPECSYREDTRKADLPLEENYFIFTGGEACGFKNLIDPDLLFAVLHDPESKVGDLMHKAGELCSVGGIRAFWKVEALFMEIIQLLICSRNKSKGKWIIGTMNEEFDSTFADEVEQYLRKNIAENVKISAIAHYMKVSESSLNHKFKDETGIAPINRLIEIRVDFAKALLSKGEKLKNIADMTGFYDEYYLSKTFKKQVGVSPKLFKNSLNSERLSLLT